MTVDSGAPRDHLRTMADGTIKQRNPVTGTEVWTVPGRANRPLGITRPEPQPIGPADHAARCAFCASRMLETPPEKDRVVLEPDGTHRILRHVPADALQDTAPTFRRVANLFAILEVDYWRRNYGQQLSAEARTWQEEYLANQAGREHVQAVLDAKRRASGMGVDDLAVIPAGEHLAGAESFFGSGHDVIIAHRHFTADARTDHQLASSGTLTPAEHRAYIAFTAQGAQDLYAAIPQARYVSVFQNWLKPAGASFDHLHKQLVAIDELGAENEAVLDRLAHDPAALHRDGVAYAEREQLVIARTEHAVLFAGFGHRYPTLEIHSLAAASDPWAMSEAERDSVADLVHAAHAATGPDVPCNEEWHTRPAGIDLHVPWRVLLKWRISTLAGFEGATKIYVNTIGPWSLRDRVLARMHQLRADGLISEQIQLSEPRRG